MSGTIEYAGPCFMTCSELTYRVIGCAMKVHSTLGSGFQEIIYQRCLAIELKKAGIDFVREKEEIVMYDGVEVGTRRVDFMIAGHIPLEIKAVAVLEDVHLAQAKNYLSAFGFPEGLLINFGGKSLQYNKIYRPLKR